MHHHRMPCGPRGGVPRPITLVLLMLVGLTLARCTGPRTEAATQRGGASAGQLERSLLQGLTDSRKAGESAAEQATIARSLTAADVIGEPFAREDYSSFHVPTHPIALFGRKVLAVEYENMDEWLGCCVSYGFAVLMPNTPGEDDALDRFARENNCKVRVGTDVVYVPDAWRKQNDAGQFIQLSCKDTDQYAEEPLTP